MGNLPRYVLGVDGGFKTGLFVYDLLLDVFSGSEVPWDRFGFETEKIIDELRPTISAEKFIITPQTAKNTQAPWTLKANGHLEQLALKYGCEYTEVTPSTAKSVISDQRLRDFGWWTKGKGHKNDAARQTGLRMLKAGWMHPSIIEGLTSGDAHDNVTSTESTEMDNVVYLSER